MKKITAYILLPCCLLVYSCATPSSPTGGPRDEQGPSVVQTEPPTGTVNYEGGKVVLFFSEFVNRSSLNEALRIEPNLGIAHSLDWGRKSVAIKFKDPIPDSTTVIITVGTEFQDMNGNAMSKPAKVAFSTGPDIDKGKLIGRVLDARTGNGHASEKVLLYRTPVDLSRSANYIAETDTSGIVNFDYLSAGKYKAFWVDDRNRNTIWDKKQERAQPFKDEFVNLSKAGKDTLGTLYVAGSDTSKPTLQGVGLFSKQRMRLRFSENISLSDSTRLQVQDSTGKKISPVYPLYISPKDGYILFAQSAKALASSRNFQLSVRNISDEAGNVQPQSVQSFTGSSQKDTTAQRIIGSSVGSGIFPTAPVVVAYAAPIRRASVRDSLKIVVGKKVHKTWKGLKIHQNKVRILPDSVWASGVDYEFRLWNPSLERYRFIKPTIWHASDLGTLQISFKDSTSKEARRPTHLLLKSSEGSKTVDTTFVGHIGIDKLAPVKHQLRLYQDLNQNGQWDEGTVAPFKAPEPYYVQNGIAIQKGFTANLSVSFKE